MSKQKGFKTESIATTIRFETHADLDRYNAAYRRDRQRIDTEAKRRTERADAARRELAEKSYGARALAAVEAIRNDNPDAQTIRQARRMEAAERAAESFCERFLVESDTATARSAALHLTVPFLAELQKVAKDALHDVVSWFEVDAEGHKPQGYTHHDGDVDLLTSVIVYATSRPGERWAVEPPTGCKTCVPQLSFDYVAETLAADCHCDLSVDPYAKKLEPFKTIGPLDCFDDMREEIENRRKLHGYALAELDMNLSRERRREVEKRLSEPASTGQLFPVAFGNQVVFLKLCAGHAFALASKYQIQVRECAIEEAWEGVGNHW